jgi:TonB family protein
MRYRRNKQAFLPAIVFCCFSVCAPIPALAGQDQTGVTHYIDTSTDRVPATTTFPKYPSVARRDRIEGEATVCFKIKANGRVSRPVVTEYSHKIFSKPALRALKKSTYEPLGPGQILNTARTCRTYRFRLDPVLADQEPGRQDARP